MRKTYILLLSLFIVSNLQAQHIESNSAEKVPLTKSPRIIIDTVSIQCAYQQRIFLGKKDTPERKFLGENIMKLQIGKQISKYWDEKVMLQDSLMDAYAEQGMDGISALNKIMPQTKGASTIKLFKNYPNGKITTEDRIPFDTYRYEEDFISPNWTISTDTITICGYVCNKAATTFRGRNYTAWFTNDIPLSNGPWKLSGLTGLILRAIDDKQEVSFECISIEIPQKVVPIYIEKNDYLKTTKKTFENTKKEYMKNPAAFVGMSGLIKGGLPANASKKRAYNPIELTE